MGVLKSVLAKRDFVNYQKGGVTRQRKAQGVSGRSLDSNLATRGKGIGSFCPLLALSMVPGAQYALIRWMNGWAD